MSRKMSRMEKYDMLMDKLHMELVELFDLKFSVINEALLDSGIIRRICELDNEEVAKIGRMVRDNIDEYIAETKAVVRGGKNVR